MTEFKKLKHFPGGSVWRKWDLHVHTKGTGKNDQFKSKTFHEFCVVLFNSALESEIAAIGITDYFSIERYKDVLAFVNNIDSYKEFSDAEKDKIKGIFLLPNIELRILPVTKSDRLINIHLIINPEIVNSLDNLLFNTLKNKTGNNVYPMNKQGIIDLGKFTSPELNDDEAYKKGIQTFSITIDDLMSIFKENKALRENVIIAVSNSNQDGASGIQDHYSIINSKESSLEAIRKSIYCISDCIFSSNERDINYFSGKGSDSEDEVIKKYGTLKPCIHGCDAHTEERLFKPDQNRFCWIKADLAFEGLKQIIYEPEPKERVWIGPTEPYKKDSFKVIKNISFKNTSDFPDSIEFNSSLNSIIGSRSSGKSSLLAYIAKSIDSEQTLSKKSYGPGEGFPWENVNFDYEVTWENGKTCLENPGSIVYIPQNHLYNLSQNFKEINEKIKPVIFNIEPSFKFNYENLTNLVSSCNEDIRSQISHWFEKRQELYENQAESIKLGSEVSLKKEISDNNAKIKNVQDKYKLKENDTSEYQTINSKISQIENRVKEINEDISKIESNLKEGNYFQSISTTVKPSIEELPSEINRELNKIIENTKQNLQIELNKKVKEYLTQISQEREEKKREILEIKNINATLIEYCKKNIEIESLVQNNQKYKSTLAQISVLKEDKEKINNELHTTEDEINRLLSERQSLFTQIGNLIKDIDQSTFKDITFGIEYSFTDQIIDEISKNLNLRDSTNYVQNHELKIDYIRNNSRQFLEDIFSGIQKIRKGAEKVDVVTAILTVCEEIRFSAIMEGDKIGGFSDSTMTAGKRALFALRLILSESTDPWPLLIDQPEDDLDSRSIYGEIVPFLKEKKKERQIIMVSHNANLVIGSDSESVIIANRNGNDRKNRDNKEFNYLSGSIENTFPKDQSCSDTLESQGIREHICQILEGGEKAFDNRIKKLHRY